MHSQTGRAFASQGNVLSQLGRKDRQTSLRWGKKKWDLAYLGLHFSNALSSISSICKYELWMPSLPTRLPTFFARKIHLWCQIRFPYWCSTNGLSEICRPRMGYSWPLRNAVLLADAIYMCCQSLCLQQTSSDQLLAASLIWLSHPGHKWFIKATEDHHKPHSFNETSHASVNKCSHDLGRGDTGRTSNLECTRDS